MDDIASMTNDQLLGRKKRVQLRIMEIDLSLAKSKQAYVCDGIERPFKERVTLEAERAELRFEKLQIEGLLTELRTQQLPSFGNVLAGLCKEAGRADLVDQANQLSTFGKTE